MNLQINGVQLLKKRILGFNCQEDAREIAAGRVTLSDVYPLMEFSMPDLTSVLCALKPEWMEHSMRYVRIKDDNGVLLFEKASKGIPICDLTTLEFEKVLPNFEAGEREPPQAQPIYNQTILSGFLLAYGLIYQLFEWLILFVQYRGYRE